MSNSERPGQVPQNSHDNISGDLYWEAAIAYYFSKPLSYLPRLSRGGKLALVAVPTALALLGGVLLARSQSQTTIEASTPSDQPIATPVASPRDFLLEYLRAPGSNGEPSFLGQMEKDGVSIHIQPVFGKGVKTASAGEEGWAVRPYPNTDEARFPVARMIEWGGCIVWEGPEVVSKNPDGSYETFIPVPEGFVRLYRSEGLDTEWFGQIGDPRCDYLRFPDGSIVYDEAKFVVGPSTADIAKANVKG